MKVQTANDVFNALCQITELGFDTEMYVRMFRIDCGVSVICSAASGPYRRYFKMKFANTKRPLINLIDNSQSEKSINEVLLEVSREDIALADLVNDGYDGVLRGLGLYRALAERGSLKLSDFKPISFNTKKPADWFTSCVYGVDLLQTSNIFSYSGENTEEAAYSAAKIWDNPMYYAVVVDQLGNAVAVFHQGKRVLFS